MRAPRERGPNYSESRFDVKSPRSNKDLRTKIYSSFRDGRFTNRQLEKNEAFYRYFGTNVNGQKVSWLTNKKYASEAEFRKDVAVPPWFVHGRITRVTTYDVPKGTWVSEGIAAPQGPRFPGGGYQATIANVPRAWKVREDRAFQ